MRLIDADALIKQMQSSLSYKDYEWALYADDIIDSFISEAPTVDAVEVVRCRECAFSRDTGDYQDTYYCDDPAHNKMYLVHSREYCSHGRKDEQWTNISIKKR